MNTFLQGLTLCLALFSALLALLFSLSFTHSLSLSPLASTDRFHNHFSEVTVLSAVVTQPLACSVSFTCTHTVCANTHVHTHKYCTHYYSNTTLRTQKPASKTLYGSLAAKTWYRPLKGQHVYFWLPLLKAFFHCLQHRCDLRLQIVNVV